MTNVDRRSLMIGLGAVAGAATAAAAVARPQAPAISRNLPDVTIVGAGAFGAWTALSLRELGARVTLLDSYGAGNARQTSGDETRQIRCAYDSRAIYSRWAKRAYDLWVERQAEFGRRMIFPNGVLSPNLDRETIAVQSSIFRTLALPFEVLSSDECARRWPQGHFEGDLPAFYEPHAGTLKARESIIAVTEAFVRKGGTTKIGLARPGRAVGGRIEDVHLADGSKLSTGMAVFACGSWLPKLFPALLGTKIRVSRYEVFYVGSPAGDPRYHWERFPNIWSVTGGYALSDVDYGYKVAPEGGYDIAIDPDTDQRLPSPFLLENVRKFLVRFAPGLLGQPIVAARVCAMEMAAEEHFIIDRLPGYDNVWVAGGGSGHAFKMGPATGEYLATRLLGIADPEEERRLFAIASHDPATGDAA